MAHCMTDIHIWSLKNQTSISDGDVGCYTYHDKQETESIEHPYLEEKARFTEGRNITWAPRNKRPEKLKDSLKELEELLAVHSCVACKWVSQHLIQLVLRNGILVSLGVSFYTGDVDKILIDKTLVGKLTSDNPCDSLWTKDFLVLCYPDKSKLDYVCFTKKLDFHKLEKISVADPKISVAELPGPVGRKLDRRLTCNVNQDVVVCWWSMATEEAWPWSPMTAEKERANMVLYSTAQGAMNLLAFTRTDCDPIGVEYSKIRPHQLFTMEQSASANEDVNIDVCVYECVRNKLNRLAVTTIALHNGVTCQDRCANEDKVLLGCEDSKVVLYDEFRKVTQMTTAAIVPKKILWHPNGTLFIVANNRTQFQIFDMALSPLLVQTVSEDPVSKVTLNIGLYLKNQPLFGHMMWSPARDQHESHLPECNDALFIAFDREPLVMVQLYHGVMGQGELTPLSLINQYIQHSQINNALRLLRGLNWNTEGKMCFACLSSIANHLLKGPLNAEAEGQLEETLGCFYAPARPINEVSVMEFRNQISFLARRFFHLLLRFSRFEKAFLLAVDIEARDLFMDLHYVAKDRGETALAEVALRKANKLSQVHGTGDKGEMSETESDGSLDDSYSGSDEEFIQGAPPLPPRSHGLLPTFGKPLPPLPVYDMRQTPQPSDRQNDTLTAHLANQANHHRLPQQGFVDMSHALLDSLEADVIDSMPQDFRGLIEQENILPPPPSHADSGTESPRTSKLKVIHLGIV